jgi:hypothetical protein
VRDGATLGSAKLAGGVATFSTADLGAGTAEVIAVYGGGPNFHGSTSNPLVQVTGPE